uniref:Uncharacterized protein n=1 Tax=Heterosigma akashiwo TaxID=2829 RepID=A0A7S3Y407_HETAK
MADGGSRFPSIAALPRGGSGGNPLDAYLEELVKVGVVKIEALDMAGLRKMMVTEVNEEEAEKLHRSLFTSSAAAAAVAAGKRRGFFLSDGKCDGQKGSFFEQYERKAVIILKVNVLYSITVNRKSAEPFL